MESTHKCRNTHYDAIEGISVSNGLDSQVILEKNTDICGIYPRNNSKLYGYEITISFLSDDLRLFRSKRPHLTSAAKVNRQPLNNTQPGESTAILLKAVVLFKAPEEAETPEWKS